MPSLLDDIFERADKLHADANLGNISEFPTFSKPENISDAATMFNFESGLADIFRHSEEMWKQKKLTQSNSDGGSLKVSRDVNQLRATALQFGSGGDADKSNKTGTNAADFDEAALGPNGATGSAYDEYSMRAIERYVVNSFERARIESERTFFNQQLADETAAFNTSLSSSISPAVYDRSKSIICARTADSDENMAMAAADPFRQLRRGTPIAPGANLNQPLSERIEHIFAQKIELTLYKNCRAIISDALEEAVAEIGEKEPISIWRKAFAICSRSLIEDDENVEQLRASHKWADHVIESATGFLQSCFKEHLEFIVDNALELANRGGVPGTIPLVEAYLNVKRAQHAGVVTEDGTYNKHPIWMVLFNCLRVGDPQAVAQVTEKLRNNSRSSRLVSILSNLSADQLISADTKIKLDAEWRQLADKCRDPFKRALYGVFLGFDCPDVNTTIEDWLWARLIACRLDGHEMTDAFHRLQTLVCSEFGEDYFVYQGGSFIIYYSALMLTGQIERAVFALFGGNHLVHAVHIAILAYQLKLLVLTPKISDDILKAETDNPSVCKLNFARLVLRYMKNFELKNINFALNYSFFLNQLDLDDNGKGARNVFKSCVSRLVYLTNEKEQILGKLDARGTRKPGLIDKFSAAFDVCEVIGYVARDTNICGDTLEACKLFELANKPNEAVKLACRLMSMRLSAAAKNRDDPPTMSALQEAAQFAQHLVARYETQANTDVEQNSLSTLCVLTDLHTFFEQIAMRKHAAALSVIQRLQFIPTTSEDVQAYVNAFEKVPEEVRLLLPEICVALMKTIVAMHDAEPPESATRVALTAHAEAIILYTAMLPYKFAISTSSVLLQLQSKIS